MQKTNTALAKGASIKEGAGITSTNAASPSPGEVASVDGTSDDVDDEKPPAVDVNLAESEHIMVDYLGILGKNSVLAVDRMKPE